MGSTVPRKPYFKAYTLSLFIILLPIVLEEEFYIKKIWRGSGNKMGGNEHSTVVRREGLELGARVWAMALRFLAVRALSKSLNVSVHQLLLNKDNSAYLTELLWRLLVI